MNQSLKDLPKPVVVDTNVLLNACFVGGSSARTAMTLLPKLGFTLLINDTITGEAANIFERYRSKHNLKFDPRVLLRWYLEASHIEHRREAFHEDIPGINRQDQHVVSAALHYAAWILTGDARLALECHRLQIPVRFPWSVVQESERSGGANSSANSTIHVGAGVSRSAGTLFARVCIGPWAATQAPGNFTVCDVENVGRLCYNNTSTAWVFEMATGELVSAACKVHPGANWTACGTYKRSRDPSQLSVTVRAGQLGAPGTQNTAELHAGINAQGPGAMAFGSSVHHTDFWNGWLQTVAVCPQPLSSDNWRATLEVSDAAPNPYDDNTLESALLRIRVIAANVYIPSEQELRGSWITRE